MLATQKLYLKSILLNNIIFKFIKFHYDYFIWKKNNLNKYFIPQKIKEKFILDYSIRNAIYVETGTYLGVTTNVIKKISSRVYTIEASKILYENATKIFFKDKNITLLYGQSPKWLKKILPKINGNINFFLDAHTVNNNKTETYKNKEITLPLDNELRIIFKYIKNFKKFSIFIDDISLLGEKKIKKLISFCSHSKLRIKFYYNILKINN